MPRPSLIDEARIKAIEKSLRAGVTRDVAAKCAGIAPATLYAWLARGRDGEKPFVELWERVKKAQAHSEEELIETIRRASFRSWQAAAWLLERGKDTRKRWAVPKEPQTPRVLNQTLEVSGVPMIGSMEELATLGPKELIGRFEAAIPILRAKVAADESQD